MTGLNGETLHSVQAHICKTDCVMYDDIDRTVTVEAYFRRKDKREVVITPNGKHLLPGLKRGAIYVLARRDAI